MMFKRTLLALAAASSVMAGAFAQPTATIRASGE